MPASQRREIGQLLIGSLPATTITAEMRSLAREFQLGGPSFAVAGEEGSGLRALQVASRMLQRGEVDVMLAGAVDLAGDLRQVLATDSLRRYSRRGQATPSR